MFDAFISLWPLWSFALGAWVLLKLARVWFFYYRRLKRM